MSSLSGFSTNSHLDEGTEEGGGAGSGAKEDKRSDPFATSSTTPRDPFAAFTIPTTSDDAFGGGRGFGSAKPSDVSIFDPFGSGGGSSSAFDPFKVGAVMLVLINACP